MRIGVPTEIKVAERRVGLTPQSVHELVRRGHEVGVQAGAGLGIGENDDAYAAAGAAILATAEDVYDQEMVVKVKEPQASERALLRPGQTLFTYLHLAPDPDQTEDLISSGSTCIAYETVTDDAGGLPLLAPMSAVAGRMAVQAGAHLLESAQGGAGILLGGVPGVAPGHVVVIGGGVVGENSAQIAVGMGARVTVLDRSPAVLDRLSKRFGTAVTTLYSTQATLAAAVADADVVIGAVLIPGDAAPKLVTRDMLGTMRPGSVLVDVAIDQGGCFETSKATTHTEPSYFVDGIQHYCVANMPGGVARTSTYALNNATLPFTARLADLGPKAALEQDPHLLLGLNVHAGMLTEPSVARVQGLEFTDRLTALKTEMASI